MSLDKSNRLPVLVTAAFHASAMSATTYVILVDLDGGDTGDYKHRGSSSLKLLQVFASLVKSEIGSTWTARIGVVLDVNITVATIHWLNGAALFSLDTSKVQQSAGAAIEAPDDFAVDSGQLRNTAGGFVETDITEVNTTAGLNNVVGNPTTPDVGDLVLRVEKVSGAGTVEVGYSIRYRVD